MRATVIAFVRMDSDGGKATAEVVERKACPRVIGASIFADVAGSLGTSLVFFARRSRLNLVHDRLTAMMARVVSALDWSALGALASADAGLGNHW